MSKIYIKPSHKGELHAELGVPKIRKIPVSTLKSVAAKGGKEAKQAQFAINARQFKH